VRRALAFILLLLLAAGATASEQSPARAAPPRLLVIGVDAVPFSIAAAVTNPALGERALFRGMRGPTAVVSSFPSTSYPAWSNLLKPFGVPPSPGYIGKYYAEHKDRVVGTPGGGDPPWLEHFDWHLDGLFAKAVAYGNSRRASANELEEALAAFAASDDPVYWIYILTTDALGHEYGTAALVDFLASLDERLAQLRASMPGRPFHTVIVSDHGMEGGTDLVNAWPAVREAMEQHGFRHARRLAEPGDAIFVPLGILSFFFVHTRSEDAAPAASVLTRVDGVDVCVRADRDDAWVVAGREGEARIARHVDAAGTSWSYAPVTGDPLGYRDVLGALRARAGDPNAVWFPDAAWFDATADGPYPDALHRLAGAFEDVTHPATLLCSLDPGYMFAARGPEILARSVIGAARWTHGALTRDATLGMLMSDVPGWTPPKAVRAESALEFLLPVIERIEGGRR
jgi:hypothetical protein